MLLVELPWSANNKWFEGVDVFYNYDGLLAACFP